MIPEKAKSEFDPLVVTTALESTWDDSNGIVWAGEWCRRHSRRHVWEPLAGRVVESQWSPERARQSVQTNRQLAVTSERLVQALGERLAEAHRLPRGERFWRIVLGAWALFYVTELHDRYMTARTVRALYPHSPVTAPAAGKYWTPTTTYEHVQAWATDDYNLQVFGAVFEALGSPLRCAAEYVKQATAGEARRKGSASAAVRLVSRLRAGRVVLLDKTYLPRYMEWVLAFRTLGAAIPVPRHQAPRALRDEQARGLLKDLQLGEGQFERLLSGTVVYDLPTVFLEGMPELLSIAQRGFPRRPSAYFSAIGWYFDEPTKLAAALAAEQGTALLGTQHGGNYGVDEASRPHEDFELSIVDHYYTWGWERPEVATATTVMPATKFTTCMPKRADHPEGVLLVSTTAPRYNSADLAWFEPYIDWQLRFARTLQLDSRAPLRVRLHRDDNGWDIASRWAECAPDVSIELWDTPFDASIRRSRVVVCDHLSTTYAQSFVADRPTVLFWDSSTELIRPEAQHALARLRDVGVLFDTPENAAQAVADLYADAESWWADNARRSAVAAFMRRYALVAPHADRIWARELCQRARRRQ
jgi:putative transferase (TIGR04331 family)